MQTQKEILKLFLINLANTKQVTQRSNGWHVYHTTLMADDEKKLSRYAFASRRENFHRAMSRVQKELRGNYIIGTHPREDVIYALRLSAKNDS